NHLIARHDRTLKARFVNTGKIVQLARLQLADAFKRQNAGGPRHCFQDQYAWENRLAREVALEKRLVNGNVFYRTQIFMLFKLKYTVNQQEWVTMREQFQNFCNI